MSQHDDALVAELDRLAMDLRLKPRARLLADTAAAHPTESVRKLCARLKLPAKTYAHSLRLLKQSNTQRYLSAVKLAANKGAVKQLTLAPVASTEQAVLSTRKILLEMANLATAKMSDFVLFHQKEEIGPEGNLIVAKCWCGDPHEQGVNSIGVRDMFAIDLKAAFANGLGGAVQEISFDKDGRPKLKLYSRMEALEVLGRWAGLDRGEDQGANESDKHRAFVASVLRDDPEAARALEQFSIALDKHTLKGGS